MCSLAMHAGIQVFLQAFSLDALQAQLMSYSSMASMVIDQETVEVSAVAPADLIAPSPHSYHTYYTPSPTYGNFRFIRVQELIKIQSS